MELITLRFRLCDRQHAQQGVDALCSSERVVLLRLQAGHRGVSLSGDGGESWSEVHLDQQLPDPVSAAWCCLVLPGARQ